jgi:hypothetical protein
LVKQPTYETKAVIRSTLPGKLFSCTLKYPTNEVETFGIFNKFIF